MSLQDEIAKYIESDKFEREVRNQIGTNPDFGKSNSSGGTKAIAEKYADEIKNDVSNALVLVPSLNFVDRMLDEYYTEVKFENGVGWIVELRFNDDAAFSPSLEPDIYEDGAYLPVIFNNGWDAKGQVFGCWATAGIDVISKRHRKSSHFIQKAVDAFNKRHARDGIKASYNPVYDGAGHEWLDYLNGYDWEY